MLVDDPGVPAVAGTAFASAAFFAGGAAFWPERCAGGGPGGGFGFGIEDFGICFDAGAAAGGGGGGAACIFTTGAAIGAGSGPALECAGPALDCDLAVQPDWLAWRSPMISQRWLTRLSTISSCMGLLMAEQKGRGVASLCELRAQTALSVNRYQKEKRMGTTAGAANVM